MQESGSEEASAQIRSGQAAQPLNEFQQRLLPGEKLMSESKELPTWQPYGKRASEILDTDAIIVRTKDGKVIAWNSVGHTTTDFEDESHYNYGLMEQDIAAELQRRKIIDSDMHILTLSKADQDRLKDLQVDFEHLTAGKNWINYQLSEDEIDSVDPRNLVPF